MRDEKIKGSPVRGVDLTHTEVTDADLKDLAALKHLCSLDLNYCTVTDVGLKELVACASLEVLNLEECNHVTDVGLKESPAQDRKASRIN